MANILSLRLDELTRARLEAAASKHGMTISEIARHILRGGLDTMLDENFVTQEVTPETFGILTQLEVIERIIDDDRAKPGKNIQAAELVGELNEWMRRARALTS